MALGDLYLRQSRYTDAGNAFLDLLFRDADHPGAHIKLGEINYLKGETEKALAHWQRAAALLPNDKALGSRISKLERQQKESRRYETVADHLFTVQFDGEKNPQLRNLVIETLQDAWFEIGQSINAWPHRQIAVTLLTRQAFFDVTGSPSWAGGIYEGQIKIPVSGYDAERLKVVLYHEYLHALVFDLVSDRCPWWLNEGLAQYFSRDDAINARKIEIARKSILGGNRPGLENLLEELKTAGNDPQKVLTAYSHALSATDFLIRQMGLYTLQTVLEIMGEGADFEAALMESSGYSMSEFEAEWITTVRAASR